MNKALLGDYRGQLCAASSISDFQIVNVHPDSLDIFEQVSDIFSPQGEDPTKKSCDRVVKS